MPEDRRLQGLVVDHSVADNLVLPSLPRLSRFGFVSPGRVAALARRLIEALAIKVSNPRERAGALSGGNQQRIVLGKWMGGSVRLLLLDEPTRGIDVGAKAELFAELRRIAGEGVAMLVASSEIDEMLPNCDRILVFFAGRLVGEFPPGEQIGPPSSAPWSRSGNREGSRMSASRKATGLTASATRAGTNTPQPPADRHLRCVCDPGIAHIARIPVEPERVQPPPAVVDGGDHRDRDDVRDPRAGIDLSVGAVAAFGGMAVAILATQMAFPRRWRSSSA